MYERAKYLIVSEIAVINGLDEKEVERQVDKALALASVGGEPGDGALDPGGLERDFPRRGGASRPVLLSARKNAADGSEAPGNPSRAQVVVMLFVGGLVGFGGGLLRGRRGTAGRASAERPVRRLRGRSALAELTRALERDPENPEILMDLGNYLLRPRGLGQARSRLTRRRDGRRRRTRTCSRTWAPRTATAASSSSPWPTSRRRATPTPTTGSRC